jgi:hypothetical protein
LSHRPVGSAKPASDGLRASATAPLLCAGRSSAASLGGEQRLHAFGQLDVDLATHTAPAVAFANLTAEDFFSARIGCQVFDPIYGIDLGALCRPGHR